TWARSFGWNSRPRTSIPSLNPRLIQYIDNDRDGAQCAEREQRPAGAFPRLATEPIGNQQTQACAKRNARAGYENNVGNRQASLCHVYPFLNLDGTGFRYCSNQLLARRATSSRVPASSNRWV